MNLQKAAMTKETICESVNVPNVHVTFFIFFCSSMESLNLIIWILYLSIFKYLYDVLE